MSDAEEPEPIDEPIELDEPTMEESSEPKGEDTANLKEEEPAQEEKADLKDESADSHNNSKKRKHKKVLKKVTKMDAEGYLGMFELVRTTCSSHFCTNIKTIQLLVKKRFSNLVLIAMKHQQFLNLRLCQLRNNPWPKFLLSQERKTRQRGNKHHSCHFSNLVRSI